MLCWVMTGLLDIFNVALLGTSVISVVIEVLSFVLQFKVILQRTIMLLSVPDISFIETLSLNTWSI